MKIQFIGIGGVGISALAKMLLNKGHQISGINDSESKKTLQELYDKQAQIAIGTTPELLDEEADLYVYSVAWLQRAPELMQKALDSGKAKSYFEALGDFASSMELLAVSGTHGKTTTVAMLHEILKAHNFAHETIVGSILAKEGSNYVASTQSSKHLLLEACEYKRHFLYFYPTVLVITNIEAEHLDYYKDLDDVKDAFESFVKQSKNGAKIILGEDKEAESLAQSLSKHLQDSGKHVIFARSFSQDVPQLKVPGKHNRKNAAAALAAAAAILNDKFSLPLAQDALANFSGTWRRQEFVATLNGIDIYTDYAHHPSEIKATIEAFKEKADAKNLAVVFEPHTYSRLQALFDEFAASFTGAHKVLVTPIYAAREEKVQNISSESLAQAIAKFGIPASASLSYQEAFEDALSSASGGGLLLVLGAGDVYDELLKFISGKK